MATMLQDGPQVLGTTWMDLAHIESTRKIIKISLTPPKTNMDTQNDRLEKVTPFKNGNFGYPC